MIKKLMQRLADLSPSCRQATRLQSTALDGKLSVSQKLGLRIHLCLCKWCRRYGSQIEFLRTASQHEPKPDESLPVRTLTPEARERIGRRLAEAQKEKQA
jgi:hypothetical protein